MSILVQYVQRTRSSDLLLLQTTSACVAAGLVNSPIENITRRQNCSFVAAWIRTIENESLLLERVFGSRRYISDLSRRV